MRAMFSPSHKFSAWIASLALCIASVMSVSHVHEIHDGGESHYGLHADHHHAHDDIQVVGIAEYFEECGAFHVLGIDNGLNSLVTSAITVSFAAVHQFQLVAATVAQLFLAYCSRAPPSTF